MMRREVLEGLRARPEISVLIVGGGINGIGTFRDLALNGVDTLLVESSDFCSGASAASSHMAHGGVRYLENGEFRLVQEAVGERNRLLRNAPHLVKPLPTTIPIFRLFSGLLNAPLKFLGWLDRPSERGSLVIKIGLMLYDAYTGASRVVPRHRFLSRGASLARWPELNPAIVHTATYYDGAILQPERLALELILDAETDNPQARALNYVSLIDGENQTITLRDELTGAHYEVKPRVVINAAGPWIDITNRTLGQSKRLIGGTKGSHLVLNHPELRAAIGEHEFFFENKDGRIVLIFPLFDRVLVGTSDIPIEDPDTARCTEEEVDYFLEMIARVFPSIKVARDDIVFRFSGVRPLAFVKSKTTGQITRDHEIQVLSTRDTGLAFPVYSLVGGKWTSYRAFSEQAAGKILEFLGRPHAKDTGQLAIGGGRGYPVPASAVQHELERLVIQTGLSAERVQVLFQRYGMRAGGIARSSERLPEKPLRTVPSYSKGEIAFIARHEKVVHLDDLLLRRSMLAMLGHLTRPVVEEIAGCLAETLAWEVDQVAVEVARFVEIMAERHEVQLRATALKVPMVEFLK